MALVEAADASLANAGVDGALLRVLVDPAEDELAWFPLDGSHPLELLLRFVVPDNWRAVGVWCAGWAHRLDETGRARRGSGSPPVTVTLLVERSGAAAGLLREGDTITPLLERPEGVVADACRRALGLPTTAPAGSTAELWALYWLDRLVEIASQADGAARLRTWPAVAALHPAVAGLPARDRAAAIGEPARLAAAALAWSDAWPWARLRAEPGALNLPWLDLTPALAAWMDDGMWSRWLLSALPPAEDLLASVHALLGDRVAAAVDMVIEASCAG